MSATKINHGVTEARSQELNYMISVLKRGGVFFAHVHNEDCQASSISSLKVAAIRAAKKFCERRKFDFGSLKLAGHSATWFLSVSPCLRGSKSGGAS